MKEAGLTPMQILKCATATPRNFSVVIPVRVSANSENGCFADLVIHNSNPLDDIAHSSDIETVDQNGRRLSG